MTLPELKKSLRAIDPVTILLFIKFLEENIVIWKEELTNCSENEFLSLQGSIKGVRMLITDLKRPVIEVKKVGTYID